MNAFLVEWNEEGPTTREDQKPSSFNEQSLGEGVPSVPHTGVCRGEVCLLQLYNSGTNETETYAFSKMKMQ